jgi:hypothetical protein
MPDPLMSSLSPQDDVAAALCAGIRAGALTVSTTNTLQPRQVG